MMINGYGYLVERCGFEPYNEPELSKSENILMKPYHTISNA